MTRKINKSAGQATKLLLVLAIIVLVAVIISYIIIKAAEKPKPPPPDTIQVPQAVYETTLNDIQFIFQEAQDKGNILFSSQSRNPGWQKDINTTEKFIKVTIGVKNKGKENVPERVWDIGSIVDSEGRIFVPLEYDVKSWLPEPDLCGSLLKPEFSPTSCVKIYEVSKISVGLKIQVFAGNKKNGEYSTDDKNRTMALLDLIVTP